MIILKMYHHVDSRLVLYRQKKIMKKYTQHEFSFFFNIMWKQVSPLLISIV
jgi:hypothetical protein